VAGFVASRTLNITPITDFGEDLQI